MATDSENWQFDKEPDRHTYGRTVTAACNEQLGNVTNTLAVMCAI